MNADTEPPRTASAPRRVAVLTHVGRPEAIAAAQTFIAQLAEHDISCLLPRIELDALVAAGAPESVGELFLDGDNQGCELVAVFGGDGSILRGAEWAIAADIAVLGINLGHVGFLAEAESSEIEETVRQVVSRNFSVEQRFVVAAEVYDPEQPGGPIWSSFAVNEVSIEKAARERMLEVMIEIDGRPLSRWGCDGVLVSTPSGSTAYAFSAGGPVMWPQLEAFLLVPLSAHALFARPLVLAPDSCVQVDLLPGPEVHGVLWCDGRRTVNLTGGMQVVMTRSPHRLQLARLSQSPFTDRLVRKFGLQVEGWRGSGARRLSDEPSSLACGGVPGDTPGGGVCGGGPGGTPGGPA